MPDTRPVLAALAAFVVYFVLGHDHVNLNIGARRTVGQAIGYFVEWNAAGVTLGLVLGLGRS